MKTTWARRGRLDVGWHATPAGSRRGAARKSMISKVVCSTASGGLALASKQDRGDAKAHCTANQRGTTAYILNPPRDVLHRRGGHHVDVGLSGGHVHGCFGGAGEEEGWSARSDRLRLEAGLKHAVELAV